MVILYDPDIKDWPEHIKNSFKYAAVDMLSSLQYNSLKVALLPAPESMHTGHRIRVAIGHNAQWYKDFFANRSAHTDRQRVIIALRRVIDCQEPKGVYGFEIHTAIIEYMVHTIEDEYAINYFCDGIPF